MRWLLAAPKSINALVVTNPVFSMPETASCNDLIKVLPDFYTQKPLTTQEVSDEGVPQHPTPVIE